MSKSAKLMTCDPQADDVVIVGFSPAMAQAGALQQTASAQALAIMNQARTSHLQSTQSLANCSKSAERTFSAGTKKNAQRILRTINAVKGSEIPLSERDI